MADKSKSSDPIVYTALYFTNEGKPVVHERVFDREPGSNAEWEEIDSTWCDPMLMLGIREGTRRSLESLKEAGERTRYKGTVVVGGSMLVFDIGYVKEWPHCRIGDEVKKQAAHIMVVAGGLHPNCEAPPADLSKVPASHERVQIRRWIKPEGGTWYEDDPKFVRESPNLRGYSEMSVGPKDLVGAIFGDGDQGQPVLAYRVKGDDGVKLLGLSNFFGDDQLLESDSLENSVHVPLSRLDGTEGALPDVKLVRVTATSQQQAEGREKYRLELFVEGARKQRNRLLALPLSRGAEKARRPIMTWESPDGVSFRIPFASKKPIEEGLTLAASLQEESKYFEDDAEDSPAEETQTDSTAAESEGSDDGVDTEVA